MNFNIFIGYDHRLPRDYAVAVRSLLRNLDQDYKGKFGINQITPLLLPDLQAKGIYTRPTYMIENRLFDSISDAPMATEFAISRFFIPYLCEFKEWSFFCDSDFLFRCDIRELFEYMDPSKAVICVKHQHNPETTEKMAGQLQTAYDRKNWSSMMMINNAHPKNKNLVPEYLNKATGRGLHAFEWLADDDIGEVGPEWNWLEGHNSTDIDAKIVHYTNGSPYLLQDYSLPYTNEWVDVAESIDMVGEDLSL
jgi:lipopolysaccharide biosynthesis glycosyltransferase